MSTGQGASLSARTRLRRIEARILTPAGSESGALVLSCFRDYFAGVDVATIAAKMRRGGMEPEMIRYYTEDIFTVAKAELTEWQEQMEQKILAMPTGPPQ